MSFLHQLAAQSSLARLGHAKAQIIFLVGTGLALGIAAVPFFTSHIYTNHYVKDALYLLNSGYIIYHGFVPHLDYVWQFGGYESYLIALSFHLFGVSVKAIEQAVILAFFVALLLLVAGAAKGIRSSSYILLLILISAVSLTRYPLEDVHVGMAYQSFSMFYNRICWVLAMVLYATVLLPSGRLRIVQLAVCACVMFLILVTKLTFVIILLPALAPIYYKNRVAGLFTVAAFICAMGIVAWVGLGFGPQAYFRSFADIMDATASVRGGLGGPLKKMIYVVIYNSFDIAVALVSIALVWFTSDASSWIRVKVGTLIGLLIASMGVTLTTGTFELLFSTVPMTAFIALVAADHMLGTGPSRQQLKSAALALYVLSFATPHLLNYTAGVAKQATRQELSFFEWGPLSGLIVEQIDPKRSPLFSTKGAGVEYVLSRTLLDGNDEWTDDYTEQFILADAIALARRIPNFANKRVLTLAPNALPFALGARPVPNFPLHGDPASPSIRRMRAIPSEVDAVLIRRHGGRNLLHERFSQSLADDFALQGSSRLWDLYYRRRQVPA